MIAWLRKLSDEKRGVILTLAALFAGGIVLGGIVFASGILPIKASSGHWPITEWFMHTGMERSVALHSAGIEPPPLDQPDLIIKGATHFEIGCRPCHGSPGLPQPRIASRMTPHSPNLGARIPNWQPNELFYIVKHGVKFTGMPAWPALHRDDEVWAVVAFLQKLPQLNEAEYRRLAQGDPRPTAPMEQLEGTEQTPSAVLQTCARCHGREGVARGSGAFPHLAGQHAEYLTNALNAYAAAQRHSGLMQPIALGLDQDKIRALADYYSRQTLPAPAAPPLADAAAIARGQAIAEHGIPAQKVASCIDCHGSGGRRHKAAYPRLAGQPADYLFLQLELFKKGHRGGSAYAHLMQAVAPRLTEAQMRDVALYFASLPPPPPEASARPDEPAQAAPP